MGINQLAEKVVSAKLPNGDNKFFDVYKFLYLNEGPATDMGFNFQASQS